ANASNDTGGAQPPSFGNIAGAPAPINIWMQVRDVPFFGNVRFGNQVKPIGFSNQVYQGFLPFLERADNWDAFQGTFDNGFAIGLTARNHSDNELVTWQYGIYRPLVNNFAVALNKVQWGGRVTALPVYEDDGRTLVHVGFGTLNGERPQDELKVRARPLLRDGPGYAVPVLVDTGEVPGSRTYILAPELAAVFGSWTFQAEWTGQFLTQAGAPNGQNQGTVLFHGGYAEVLYFLTGEYQSYDKAAGAFGRVVPNRNLRIKRGCGVEGCGAWQVGVGFSYRDLDDKAIRCGRLPHHPPAVHLDGPQRQPEGVGDPLVHPPPHDQVHHLPLPGAQGRGPPSDLDQLGRRPPGLDRLRERPADGRQQVALLDRLEQVVHGAGLQGPDGRGRV